MVAVVLVWTMAADRAQLDAVRGDAVATLLYVANWHEIATTSSYWAIFDAPSPLQHTWSLAIEEQFYLAWPLVVGVASPSSPSACAGVGPGRWASSPWVRPPRRMP